MKAAYVDTSCILAIAFGERGAAKLEKSLNAFDRLLSSNLLEAELRAAFRRENATVDPATLLDAISWIHPAEPLTKELETILAHGYVRGADLWHLAVALFVDPGREISFLTLDERQRNVAARLGFGR